MQAMVLRRPGGPLESLALPDRELGAQEVRIAVGACGVCRTDLHVLDNELPALSLPRIPGHEVVGRIVECGAAVRGLAPGQRVGVPWLAQTCGACEYCAEGRENLCDHAQFTGYTRDGGFATHCIADARYVLALPDGDDVATAPLLCAGLIGWRALQAAPGRRLGLYGFGAAAHIIAQVAASEGREIYAFTRAGDETTQRFALTLGACWAGPSTEPPPRPLDAAIIFAPIGELVPAALRAVRKGGTVVCAGIHMSPIPSFPYEILWQERQVRSIANLTRRDGEEFLRAAARIAPRTHTHRYRLADANAALADLRAGRFEGAAVLVP